MSRPAKYDNSRNPVPNLYNIMDSAGNYIGHIETQNIEDINDSSVKDSYIGVPYDPSLKIKTKMAVDRPTAIRLLKYASDKIESIETANGYDFSINCFHFSIVLRDDFKEDFSLLCQQLEVREKAEALPNIETEKITEALIRERDELKEKVVRLEGILNAMVENQAKKITDEEVGIF